MRSELAPQAPELRDVRGPSAFAGGRERFLALLWLSARMEFKATYKGPILGYVWGILRPLGFFGVLYVVFTQILRFGGEVPYYAPLLLLNIMLFYFFNESVGAAVGSLVRSERIVRKTQFPRAVIPLSIVLNRGFTLVLNLAVVAAFVLVSGVEPRWTWLLFPLVIGMFVVVTACTALLLSALYTRFRDVSQAWTVISRVTFYGSPILYPIEYVPESFHSFYLINPLAPLFIEARRLIFDPGAPSTADVGSSSLVLVGPIVVFSGICVLGVSYFTRRARRIAEDL